MRLYTDPSLNIEITFLDLGIVLAGEHKEYSFYIKNDKIVPFVDLKFVIDNPEIEILDFPRELKSGNIGTLRIKWSPSITLKQGLHTELQIKGYELYS